MLLAAVLAFWRVRVHILDGSEAQQENVTLVILGLPEVLVSAMESVQHTHHPVHLVEPVKQQIVNYLIGGGK